MTFWLTLEQRRTLRTWSLVMAGPALVAVVIGVVAILTWAFGPAVAPLARINYLGSIGIVLAILVSIPLLTYAAEISLRSFKGSAGSVSFEATGGEAQTATATVANAAGDTASASVPAAPPEQAP